MFAEEFQTIDQAFYKEKQGQGWGRKKREALINGRCDLLSNLSRCQAIKEQKEMSPVVELVETTTKQGGFNKLNHPNTTTTRNKS